MREGRRREFAALPAFKDAKQREKIPDPNAHSTFEQSKAYFDVNDAAQAGCLNFYRDLLTLRRTLIVPHLIGCRSTGAEAITECSVIARWQLGNGDRLTIAVNFGDESAPLTPINGERIFASDRDDDRDRDNASARHAEAIQQLSPRSARAWIEKAITE